MHKLKTLSTKSLIPYIKSKYKTIIVLILVISIIFTLYKITPKDLKIYFIDVGQGDSCLIVTPLDTKILIDGRRLRNL